MKVTVRPEWLTFVRGLGAASVAVALTTLVLHPFESQLGTLNVGLIFLLLVLVVSARLGRAVGIATALSANIVLNVFFIEPHRRISVEDWPGILGLVVFLGVSIVGGSLLASARSAAAQAQRRQEELETLLGLSRTLNAKADPKAALSALCSEVVSAFHAPGASVLSQREGAWSVLAAAGDVSASRLPDERERRLAEEALATGQLVSAARGSRAARVSRGLDLLGPEGGRALFIPLRAGDRTFGILRLDGPLPASGDAPDAFKLLEPFVTEAALAVHRLELAQAAAHADALRQADELKTALMTSISHDLKTPIAGIKASVTSLLDASVSWSEDDRRAFLEAIESQSDRLDRVISDILNLNRIEQGTVAPFMESVLVCELLEESRERTAHLTRDRDVVIEAPPDLEVEVDEALIIQALVNLIENAAKYSPPGTPIKISAQSSEQGVELAVEDRGPGVAPEDLPHVFDRFYRGTSRGQRVSGSGLGLAVVRGFARLCGGDAYAERGEDGGSRFVIRFPAQERSPVKT